MLTSYIYIDIYVCIYKKRTANGTVSTVKSNKKEIYSCTHRFQNLKAIETLSQISAYITCQAHECFISHQ